MMNWDLPVATKLDMWTEETSHFQITKGILQTRAVYWQHLEERADDQKEPLDSRPRRSKSRRVGRSSV